MLPATVSPPVQAEACRTILAVAANVHVKRGEMWKVEVVSADGHHFGGPIRFDRAPVGPAIFSLGIPADYQRQPGDSRAPRVEGSHKVRVFDPRGRLVAEGDVGIVRERPGPPEESGCQSAAAAVK